MRRADYTVTLERTLKYRGDETISTIRRTVKATCDTEALKKAEEELIGWEAVMTTKGKCKYD